MQKGYFLGVLLIMLLFAVNAHSQQLQIIYPNGGEIIPSSSTATILWQSSGISANAMLTLEISNDGGTSWKEISNTVLNSGYYSWRPEQRNFSYTCRVRVRHTTVQDISDTNFTLAPQWEWLRGLLSNNTISIADITADKQGNSYVVGWFAGIVQTGVTTQSITSVSTTDDIFIAKYDANGVMSWIRRAGGIEQDRGKGIAVDNDGNVYITGYYRGTISFPGGTIASVTSATNSDQNIFIAKYNSEGTPQWVRRGIGLTTDEGTAITVDNNNNVIVTGFHFGNTTFDGGNNPLLSVGSGEFDFFIVKYNSNGDIQWLHRGGSPNYSDYGQKIKTDANGNIYILARFGNTANFSGTSATIQGFSFLDWLLIKYNTTGQFQWARAIGTTNENDYPDDIAVNAEGTVFISGPLLGIMQFSGSGTTLSKISNSDIAFVSYNTNGNLLWARAIRNTNYVPNDMSGEKLSLIQPHPSGAIVAISFRNTLSLPMSTNGTLISRGGGRDIALINYNTIGTIIFATSAGSTSEDIVVGLTEDKQGNIFLATKTFPLALFTTPTTSGVVQTSITKIGGHKELYTVSGSIIGTTSAGVRLESSLNVTTSSLTGNFALSLPTGTHNIRPLLQGYTFSPTIATVVVTSSNIENILFSSVEATFQINGTVVNMQLPTLANIQIIGSNIIKSTSPIVTGGFTFSGLKVGEYTLSVTAPGYDFLPSSIPITITETDIVGLIITAEPLRYSVTGTILGISNPQQLQIQALSNSTSSTIAGSASYVFERLLPGEYTLIPSLAGATFTPSQATVTITTASIGGIDFIGVETIFSISGTVQQHPIPNSVFFTCRSTSGTVSRVQADINGNYQLQGLPAGTYTITPESDTLSFQPLVQTVTITNANINGVNFATIIPTYQISGNIQGIPDNITSTIHLTSSGYSSSGTVLGSGEFIFNNTPSGTYVIRPEAPGYQFTPQEQTYIIGNTSVTSVNFNALPISTATMLSRPNWQYSTITGGDVFDAFGNSYLVLTFTEEIKVAGRTIRSRGDADILIMKFSPTGAIIFAETIGGTGSQNAMTYTVSPSGTLYIYIQYSGFLNINSRTTPGNGNGIFSTTNGKNFGRIDLFAEKGGYYSVSHLVCNGNEQLYIAGTFGDTLVGLSASDTKKIVSTERNYPDLFVARHDNIEGFRWLRKFHAPGAFALEFVRKMAAGGNAVFLYARSNENIILNDNSSIPKGEFLMMLQANNGSLQWYKNVETNIPRVSVGSNKLRYFNVTDIATSGTEFYVAGNMYSSFIFSRSNSSVKDTIQNSSLSEASYLICFNQLGNKLWHRKQFPIDPDSRVSVTNIHLDAQKNAYLAGEMVFDERNAFFYESLQRPTTLNILFEGGGGNENYLGTSGNFILRYNPTGSLVWSQYVVMSSPSTSFSPTISDLHVSPDGIVKISANRSNVGMEFFGNSIPNLSPLELLADSLRKKVKDFGKFTAVLNSRYLYSVSGIISEKEPVDINPIFQLTGGISRNQTAVDNTFNIEYIPNGLYSLTPVFPGYSFEPANLTFSVSNASVSQLHFAVFPNKYSISGAIAGANTAFLPPPSLTLTSSFTSASIEVQPDRSFIFRPVITGTYTLTPSGLGYDFIPISTTITITDANVTNTTFLAVPKRYTISGTIQGMRSPTFATVRISSTTFDTTVSVNSQGAYICRNLLSGEYNVSAEASGNSFTPSVQVVRIGFTNRDNINFTARQILPRWNKVIPLLSLPNSIITSLTEDATGNMYIAGYYEKSLSVAQVSFPAVQRQSGFLAKLSPQGTVLWNRAIYSSSTIGISGIAFDGDTSVYVVGQFYDTLFADGIQQSPLLSLGQSDVFHARYSHNGTPLWIIRQGGKGYDSASGVTAYKGGSGIIGNFSDTMQLQQQVIVPQGASDIFIHNYSSAGELRWHKQFRATGSEQGTSIHILADSIVVVTGWYSGVLSNVPSVTPLLSAQLNEKYGYVAAIENQQGNILWSTSVAGGNVSPRSLDVSASNTILLSGSFTDSLVLTSTTKNFGQGLEDGFIAQFTPLGTPISSIAIGSSQPDATIAARYTLTGDIIATGLFSAPISLFNGQQGTLVPFGESDIYSIRFTASGIPQWCISAGGLSSDSGKGIMLSQQGQIWIGGSFQETAFFAYGTPSILTSAGGTNGFIASINENTAYSITGFVNGETSSDIFLQLSGTSTDTILTTSEGYFGFSGLAPGTYTITPSKAGFVFTPTSATINVTSSNIGVNFISTALRWAVQGKIAIENPTLPITITAQHSSFVTQATVTSTGTYTIPHLLPGTYIIQPTVTFAEVYPTQQIVTITNDDIQHINFTVMPRTYSIEGRIIGVTSGEITTIALQSGILVTTCTIIGENSYTFHAVPAGDYHLRPISSTLLTPRLRTLQISDFSFQEENFELSLPDDTLPRWGWSQSFGMPRSASVFGSSNNFSEEDFIPPSLCSDATGTTYTVGAFRDSVYIDNEIFFTTASASFIHARTSQGITLWKNTFSEVRYLKILYSTTGSLYALGFAPVGSIINNQQITVATSVVSHISTSGTILWNRLLPTSISATDIALRNNGGYVVVGKLVSTFVGSVLNSSGAAVQITLPKFGLTDAVVASFLQNGTTEWVFRTGNPNAQSVFDPAEAVGVGIDNSNNIYITGHFERRVEFGSTSLFIPDPSIRGNFRRQVFIAKLSSQGVPLWAYATGGNPQTYRTAHGIVVSESGNSYIVGQSSVQGNSPDELTIGGSATLFNPGRRISFLTGFTPQGTLIVHRAWENFMFYSITQSAAGNIFLAGEQNGTHRSNQIDDNIPYDINGGAALFKISSSGQMKWALTAGNRANSTSLFSVATDEQENIFGSGYIIGGTPQFIGSRNRYNSLQARGSRDFFIVKVGIDTNTIFTSIIGVTPETSVSMTLNGSVSASVQTRIGNGGFTYRNIETGEYSLIPSAKGYKFLPDSRLLYSNELATTTASFLAIPFGQAISGSVLSATPLVSTVFLQSGNLQLTTTLTASADFSFAELPAGIYTITPKTNSLFSFSPSTRTVQLTTSADIHGISFVAHPIPFSWIYPQQNTLFHNDTVSLTWQNSTSASVPSRITLEYSTNGGIIWHTIVKNITNTGSFTWKIPPILTNQVLWRIADATNSNIMAQSNPFSTFTTPWSQSYALTEWCNDIQVQDITTDKNGNILITGSFAGLFTLPTQTTGVRSSRNTRDIFVAKLLPNGTPLWLRTLSGPSGSDQGTAIAVDANDNILVAGNFTDSLIGLPSGGIIGNVGTFNSYAFIAKYSSEGSLNWIKHTARTTSKGQIATFVKDIISSENDGSLVLILHSRGGELALPSSLTGGAPEIIESNSNRQISVIMQLTSTGVKTWSRTLFSNEGDVFANAISVNHTGDVFTVGSFGGTLRQSNSSLQLVGSLTSNGFITRFSSTGSIQWNQSLITLPASSNGVAITSLRVQKNNSIIIGGVGSGNITYVVSTNAVASINTTTSSLFIASLSATMATVNWITPLRLSALASGDVNNISLAGDSLIYATGRFAESMPFSPISNIPITAKSLRGDLYLVAFLPNGEHLYTLQGGYQNFFTTPTSLVSDRLGNTYIAGLFTERTFFGGTPLIGTGEAKTQSFIAKIGNKISSLSTFTIAGNISGVTSAGISVQLLKNSVVVSTATTNAIGRYTFRTIPEGEYSIQPIATNAIFMPELRDIYLNGNQSQLHFSTTREQRIPLNQGWNEISGYLIPSSSSTVSVLERLRNMVILRNISSNQAYSPLLGVFSLQQWNPTQSYMLFSNSRDTLRLRGIPYVGSLALDSGWNTVAFTSSVPLSPQVAFASISNKLVAAYHLGTLYFPALGVNTIGTINPGTGLRLFMNAPGVLEYPSSAPRLAITNTYQRNKTPQLITPIAENTGENAFLIVIDSLLQNGDEIAVLTNEGICIGTGVVSDFKANLTIWGDNILTSQKDGAFADDMLNIVVYKSTSLSLHKNYLLRNALLNKPLSSFRFIPQSVVLATPNNSVEKGVQQWSLFPNPNASSAVTIQSDIPLFTPISTEIIDIHGKIICPATLLHSINGKFILPLDNIASGVYYINITNGKNSTLLPLHINR